MEKQGYRCPKCRVAFNLREEMEKCVCAPKKRKRGRPKKVQVETPEVQEAVEPTPEA
jgi:hypothetical protein